jgi:predicted site-specific integrase-resolvase
MTDKFVSTKIALAMLGISHLTLIKMADNKKIEIMKTEGGHRKYNIDKYIRDNKITIKGEEKKAESPKIEKVNICYVRVSSIGQKDDLVRQRAFMKRKYPDYEIIEDIGSGINFNRKGLRRIISMAIAGKISKLIVAYKDRLTRFGYELIEDLIKEYSNGEIIIVNDQNDKKEPKEELVEDVLQILNVYTAKMNGLRKYGKA